MLNVTICLIAPVLVIVLVIFLLYEIIFQKLNTASYLVYCHELVFLQFIAEILPFIYIDILILEKNGMIMF